MKHTFFPLMVTLLLVAACKDGSIGQQWLEPDKEFTKFEQPDVPTISGTFEKSAADALKAGDMKRAIGFYTQMLESKKLSKAEQLRAKLGMAEATRRSGDFDRALTMYDTILKETPSNVDALEGHGLTLMGLGKIAESGQSFKQVMAADSKRWRTLNALGILFAAKDMMPEAMAYYTEALKVSPDNSAVLNNVGITQAMNRNFPRAIETFEQALRVSPSDVRRANIEMNLALIYGIRGDLDKAKAIAGKHLKGPALDNNLGLYSSLANNKELAKAYLNQALTHSPTYYERAWSNLDIINQSGKGDSGFSGSTEKRVKINP
jgi:Flp pilus assembly protein TadD